MDLIAALSLASDLAVGLPAEHAVRSCYMAMHVADELQLPAEQQVDVYYADLLMDAGCTAWTSQLLAGVILSHEISARLDFVFHRNARDPQYLRSIAAVRPTSGHVPGSPGRADVGLRAMG